MSTIQYNTTDIHHFSKLVHPSATLRRSYISKSHGIRTELLLHLSPMSSRNVKNRLGLFKSVYHRSLSVRRRSQELRKMNDVALELVDDAIASGVKAKYILFDNWFASPHMFSELVKRHRDGIGMLKKTTKVYFRYRDREMDMKILYDILRRSKWPTKSQYLYSLIVTLTLLARKCQ